MINDGSEREDARRYSEYEYKGSLSCVYSGAVFFGLDLSLSRRTSLVGLDLARGTKI